MKLRLFLIKEYREDINYILDLLELIRKHNIFYILLLEKVPLDILLRTVLLLLNQNNKEYNIKEILDYKKVNRKIRYLVK